MIRVDCRELSTDEELALASAISDALAGRAVALVKKGELVLDVSHQATLGVDEVNRIVWGFISRRKDAKYYTLSVAGEVITVHPPVPVAKESRRNPELLPPNLMRCPYCGYVTQYEEEFVVHTRAHGIVAVG